MNRKPAEKSHSPTEADRADTFKYYLFSHRWKEFSLIGFVGLVGGLIDLAIPLVMGRFIDSLWGKNSGLEPHVYLVILAALMIVSTALMTTSDYFLGLVAESTVFGLRRRLIERVFRQPIPWYQSVSSGDWNSRLTNDPEKVRVSINNGPVEVFQQAVLVIGTLSIMLWINHLLVGVVVMVAIIGSVLVLVLSAKLEESVGQSQDRIGELSDEVISGFENIRAIRGNNLEEQYTNSILNSAEVTYQLGRVVAKNKALVVPVGGAVAQLSLIIVFGLGGWFVSEGRMSTGDFIAFLLLVVYLAVPLGTLFNAYSVLRSSKVAFSRIVHATPATTVDDLAGPKYEETDSKSGIQFDSVYFRYPGGQPILENYSFTIPIGKTFALLGPSGSGKSTIFDLLVKFISPDSGTTRIFGTDISNVSNESVRELIAFCQQRPVPFGRTIRSYLASAKEGLSDEDMWQALRRVSLDSKVRSLNLLLDSHLGVRGSMFSGGELQRLSLAFCLLRSAPIVLLDEPTMGLDKETQAEVMECVLDAFSTSTCIIATHSKEVADLCDGFISIGSSLDRGIDS